MSKIKLFRPVMTLTFVIMALALYAPQANATAIVFTDRTAWEAAAGGTFTNDAFSTAMANADLITFDSGVVSEGVPSGQPVFNRIAGGSFDGFIDPDLGNANGFSSITWTFPFAITAFGADWTSTNTAEGLTFTGDFGMGSETISLPSFLGSPGNGFLGIVAGATFDVITFGTVGPAGGTATGEQWQVDDLSFSISVPEPTTLSLFAIGLAGLGFMMRRRRRVA